jgi:hypothetical protein
MANVKDAEAFAQKLIDTVGPGETLLMAMRLVLAVGQMAPDDEQVVAAAQEAISAIKRIGTLTGALIPS